MATSKRAADPTLDEATPKVKKQKGSHAQQNTAEADVGGAGKLANGESVDNTSAPSKQKLDKIKWKKLAMQVLQDSNGSMKLSKLQKQLRTAAKVSEDVTADALIASRLNGSSQFVMKGKLVSLAAST